MNNKPLYHLSNDGITITLRDPESNQISIHRKHNISREDRDYLLKLCDSGTSEDLKAIHNYFYPIFKAIDSGLVRIEKGEVQVKINVGEKNESWLTLPTQIAKIVKEAIDNKEFDWSLNISNFCSSVVKNPLYSDSFLDNLFMFLSDKNCSILSDGNIVGYKAVLTRDFHQSFVQENCSKAFENPHLVLALFNLFNAIGDEAKKHKKSFSKTLSKYFSEEVINGNRMKVMRPFLEETFEEMGVPYFYFLFPEEIDTIKNVQTCLDVMSNSTDSQGSDYIIKSSLKAFDTPEKAHKAIVERALSKEKEVGFEFTDIHSRTTEITIGSPVSMPRRYCNTNPHVGCGSGLHVGSFNYAKNFKCDNDTGNILLCVVKPEHVVSVPADSSYQKMRCCEYLPVKKLVENNVILGNYSLKNNFQTRFPKINTSELSSHPICVDVEEESCE